MFRDLIKSAFRNIANKFGYSFLNILGMTPGITSALFLILYVSDELRLHLSGVETSAEVRQNY